MIKIKKNIITAINNPNLNNELKKEKYLNIVGRDLQYREAILEMLEINKIDILIIYEQLPGNIEIEELIKKIKFKNEKIKIILILEKENKEKEIKLNKLYNIDIYYNNKLNIKELIKIINEKEIGKEELKEEIKKLENIIKENNYKINNKLIKNNNNINNKKTEKNINNNYKNKYKNKTNKKEIKNKSIKLENKKNENIDFFNDEKESIYEKRELITATGGSDLENLIFLKNLAQNYKNQKLKEKILIIDFEFPKENIFKNKKNNINLINNKNKILEKIEKIEKIEKNKNNKLDNKINNKTKNKIKIEEIKKLIINKINSNLYFLQNYYLILKIKKINNNLYQKILNQIKNNFSIILINLKNDYKLINLNKKIIEKSTIDFILLSPNIEGIKYAKELLNYYEKSKTKVIINKNIKRKINKEIIKKIIKYNKKIYYLKINKKNNRINNSINNKIKKYLIKNIKNKIN